MIHRIPSLVFTLLTCLSAATPAVGQNDDVTCAVEVTHPRRPGQAVGAGISVEGTVQLPTSGHHLWVFARRSNFKDLWWPQGEGVPYTATGRWSVYATIGNLRDVGWTFDMAVAVFAEEQHLQLRDYLMKSMKAGEFRPIEMPEVACAPILLQVRKTSTKD